MKPSRLVAGVGVNDANYKVFPLVNGIKTVCPYYQVWKHMLWRCYSEKALGVHPTYKDCFVCDEWLVFSNFKKWMVQQNWEGKEIDKDLLVPGNKVYSPDTCIFITKELNNLLRQSVGVSFHKPSGKYNAYCKIQGKQKNKLCETVEDARMWYIETKRGELLRIANLQSNPVIKEALLNHVYAS